MKTFLRLLISVLFVTSPFASQSQAQTPVVVSDAQAAQYVGQNVTVEGVVTAVTTSGKGNTFINFGGVYPNQTPMPISDKAIKDLPLGKDVEKAINDCIQDWEGAIEWSIDHLPDPPVGFSWLDWSIGLVGNMLWAVTVFFPPAFAIATPMEVARGGVVVARIEKLVFASASAATKAASVLGRRSGRPAPKLAEYYGRLTVN